MYLFFKQVEPKMEGDPCTFELSPTHFSSLNAAKLIWMEMDPQYAIEFECYPAQMTSLILQT